MANLIQTTDLRMQTFYLGPGTSSSYRFQHLPTGSAWHLP